MDSSNAPWNKTQVENINRFQQDYKHHAFTCGSGNRTDQNHLDGQGVLIATTKALICPYCDYKQIWCHKLMVDYKG